MILCDRREKTMYAPREETVEWVKMLLGFSVRGDDLRGCRGRILGLGICMKISMIT